MSQQVLPRRFSQQQLPMGKEDDPWHGSTYPPPEIRPYSGLVSHWFPLIRLLKSVFWQGTRIIPNHLTPKKQRTSNVYTLFFFIINLAMLPTCFFGVPLPQLLGYLTVPQGSSRSLSDSTQATRSYWKWFEASTCPFFLAGEKATVLPCFFLKWPKKCWLLNDMGVWQSWSTRNIP